MTYRIKVPPRTLPVGEEQLVSGLEHWLIGLKNYRWSLVVGFVLLLLMHHLPLYNIQILHH